MEVRPGQRLGQRRRRRRSRRSTPAARPSPARARAWWKSSSHCADEPVTASLARGDQPRVVEVGLGDQDSDRPDARRRARPPRPPVPPGCAPRGDPRARAPRRGGARRCGSPAATSARCSTMNARTSSDPAWSRLTAGPHGVMCASVKYGPNDGEPVPRADVVVDDVEEDGEAARVAGVHEPLQRVGPAVGLVHRPQADPVVPPAVLARERGERHQLHRRSRRAPPGSPAARWRRPASPPG